MRKTWGVGVYGQNSKEQLCDPDLETILTEQQGSWRVLTAWGWPVILSADSQQQVQVVKLSNTTTITCPLPQDHKSTTQISNYKYTLTNVLFFTYQAVLPCCLMDYCFHSCWKTSALPCPVLTCMIPPSHKEEGLLSFMSDYDWTCFVLVSMSWNTDLNTWPFRLFSQVDFTIQNKAVKLMSHVKTWSVAKTRSHYTINEHCTTRLWSYFCVQKKHLDIVFLFLQACQNSKAFSIFIYLFNQEG